MAKRHKLPDEDLAAAVADMINSPITRANLSFLEPFSLPTPSSTVLDYNPGGSEAKPMGFAVLPGGLSEDENAVDLTSSSSAAFPPNPPFFHQPEANPLPIQQAPAASPLPVQQSLALPIPTTLWQAETLGCVFPSTRVRKIQQAQDALSPVEERVYNLLWGPRTQSRDEFRLTQFSLQRIANEARINLKTVRLLVPRLIEKGFLEIAAEADVRRNIPTTYRVWSYSAILERLRQQERSYVVKTGRGVFFAHPVQATVAPLSATEVFPEPMGSGSAPVGLEPMGPMGSTGIKPMGSTGTLSLDIYLGNTEDTTTTPLHPKPFEPLSAICRELFGAEPDHQILSAMIADCHQRAIATTGLPATSDEILYFARLRAQVIRRAPNIRNHIAVLRKALPECFIGPTFRAYRTAAIPAYIPEQPLTEDSTERHRLWTEISQRHKTSHGFDLKAIAEDDDLDELGRQQARQMLQRLGRYASVGL